MEPHTTNPVSGSFRGMGLAPALLDVLDSAHFTTPTPIQERAIPHAVVGTDVIGVAQTGTGKTLAFGLPLVQRLLGNQSTGLILVPTRELALQVAETLARFGKPLHLSGTVLIGGAAMGPQVSDLRRKPRIIIATPGRLLDHMRQGTIRLDTVSMLVLDEADRMLDMGFWPQVKEIMNALTSERQTMLFSATLSREIVDLARKYMKTPTSIEVAPPGTTAEKVTQEFFFVRKQEKPQLLEKVLEGSGSTIVFLRTKHTTKKIARLVRDMGYTAAEIHGNRTLGQRTQAIEGFRSGKIKVLVATDIAARGIDVKGVELVVNYDMPMKLEDYVHRIGRTARAGTEGKAISFVLPEERRVLNGVERLIRKHVQISKMPVLPPARAVSQTTMDEPFRGRSQRRGPFRRR